MSTAFHSLFHRTRKILRCSRILLLMVLCVAALSHTSFARAASSDMTVATGGLPLGKLRLPEGSHWTTLAERMWIHGQSAQVLVFDAPQSMLDLMRTLSSQQPALADLIVLPGQILLSGQVGQEHWVAQLQGTESGRTAGTIATLSMASSMGETRPAWLPVGWRLRLDVAVMEANVKVADRIWQHALPPPRSAVMLEAGLLREGWSRGPDEGASQFWHRERARMRVSLLPFESGSSLQVREWTR